jgi:ABC-type uncharacterized transport system substrate-binding protein
VQELAKEVAAAQPDVILSYSTPASAALQRESRTIPIVFEAGAPGVRHFGHCGVWGEE